jgi:hypothetical protein
MFMGRVNGINLYKHGIARMYLNLDDSGQCYVSREHWKFEKAEFACELTKLEAALAELGETLESAYDEAYIAQKRDALRKVGIPHWGDGAWCPSELVWMTLGLSAKFFPRARAPLADEACDLVRDLVCDVYFV